MTILQDLSQVANRPLSELSKDELVAMIANMRNAPSSRISMKVSEKGCLSLYGLNTRGIHLYASQWERIIAHASQITAFIKAHPDLARKAAVD